MVKSQLFVPRSYRYTIKDADLISFLVTIKETDLYVSASTNLKNEVIKLVKKYRNQLENFIEENPIFLTTLKPVNVSNDAPVIVRAMAEASEKVGVGPMAAVAGAIAEFVGKELSIYTTEIIIENGGDIYIDSMRKRIVSIYAGDNSLFTGRIGIELAPEDTPLGICTSSGTLGHSLSFGKTDAAVILADSATLADAAATALGNMVNTPEDIEKGIASVCNIKGIRGILVIIGNKLGVWGNIKLVNL